MNLYKKVTSRLWAFGIPHMGYLPESAYAGKASKTEVTFLKLKLAILHLRYVPYMGVSNIFHPDIQAITVKNYQGSP